MQHQCKNKIFKNAFDISTQKERLFNLLTKKYPWYSGKKPYQHTPISDENTIALKIERRKTPFEKILCVLNTLLFRFDRFLNKSKQIDSIYLCTLNAFKTQFFFLITCEN